LRSVPRPTGALVTRWDSDPWARGAYSALPPGVAPNVRRLLADAVIGGRIVLAGEYASSGRPSTTTGAHDSGRLAGRLIAESAQPGRAIVIGAGLAGATAAAELTARGVDVVVLEARDRVGGRIRTDRSWGVPIELGASWIHGLRGNSMVPLAAQTGLSLARTDVEDAVARDTATGRHSPEAERRWSRLDALLGELSESAAPRGQDVGSWLASRGWGDGRFDSWAAQVEVAQEYGRDPDRLGVRAAQEGDEYRGGDSMVVGGYARIPEALLEGIDVRLRSPVAAVTAERSGVDVTMADGSVQRTDAVVVAVPLEVLRAGVVIVAPLPSRVRAALGSLRTGDLEKVVLRYAEPWWGEEQVIGVVGGGVPGAPAGGSAALRWTEFYSLTEVIGEPALMGLSGGSAARRRPRSDAACAAEAAAALAAAFSR
jgi:monoamine oxidase